mmetsp:Transcript_72071/g.199792  ORF Transcript_72071/g.199792 Transcript_72071/m.199792 type:complete len:300 (-) Transcript_72071:581-1480(-)
MDALEERRIIGELRAVARDHLLELRGPSLHLRLAEALRQHVESHLHGRGGPRRCAEQATDGAVRGRHHLCAELEDADLLGVLLHDLHPLARRDKQPVLWLCGRHEVLQLRELRRVGREELLHQVHREVEVLEAGGGGGDQVVGPDGLEEVEERARLEVPGAEAGEGPEEEHVLAADDALVQVRHGHRRGPDGRLAVDLRGVLVHDVGVLADEELAGDREAHEAADLGDAGLLQQQQRPTARAAEDKPGSNLASLGAQVVLLHGEQPLAARLLRRPPASRRERPRGPIAQPRAPGATKRA